MSGVLGGVSDSAESTANSLEINDLAKFAVDEHNKKENSLLEFGKVLKAKEQVVAGTMHHLTVEVLEAGKKAVYEAKVWVKPWANFKQLEEFKHVSGGDSGAAVTPSDLGVKQDGHEPGWQTVPVHDPSVKEAADHAVKTIQQRSNSLAPYELLEILHSKAEIINDSIKFDLLLKIKRGSKEHKYKAEVHKNVEGMLHLNQMEEDHS
ncbi:hypothetical protein ACHQM5_018577 [Ranunculus cassubicifolius]